MVWYHRENAADAPPALATEVLKLVTEHLLPIRLSSQPDFSDTVTPSERLDHIFAPIREKAAQRQLVILRPDDRPMVLPALEKGPPDDHGAQAQSADGKSSNSIFWSTDGIRHNRPRSLDLQYDCFRGAQRRLPGCGCPDRRWRAARVSAARLGQGSAQKAMRNPQILVHDRATHQLRKA